MADYLKVATVTTATKACKIVDLSALTSEANRGDSEPMPYVDGQVVYFGWLDQIETNLELKINGFWTVAGAVATDISDTLDDNVEHYRALFMDNTDAAGRVAIELFTGNRTLDGLMQCRRWEPVRTGPGTKTVVARVCVGSGVLT